MNQTVLVGRLVRDVNVRQVGDNHRVVNNTLAVNRHHKNRNGEVEADFIPIVAWDYLADLLKEYVQKGDQISVSGRMQSRQYTDENQQTVYVVELLVREVTLLNNGRTGPTRQSVDVPDAQALKEAMQVPTEHSAAVEA